MYRTNIRTFGIGIHPPLAKALDRFFDAIMQGILRHIDFSIVKCVLVGSPGFVKVSRFIHCNTGTTGTPIAAS